VVAVVRSPETGLTALADLPPDPLLVVVDGVEKPGNLGAILRSADGAGAAAVIAADARTDLFNPNVVRASLGTVFTMPVAAADTADVRRWLEARGVRVVAARVDADRSYAEADLRGAVAIVLGSEATGLGTAWAGPGVEAVALPMRGIGDSLNVAAAAAIVLYEALRQRTVATDPAD
jgi:TrmH family RNA methyltransferase